MTTKEMFDKKLKKYRNILFDLSGKKEVVKRTGLLIKRKLNTKTIYPGQQKLKRRERSKLFFINHF